MTLSYAWFEQVWFLAIALVVVFLPGLAWIAWSKRNQRDLLELLADAAAISIAAIAFFGLLFFLARWQFSALIIFLLYMLCLLAFIAGMLRRRIQMRTKHWVSLFGVVLLMAGATAWRLYQANMLALPAWVDSVHHVLVVQKIIDARGLPATLAPELPVSFTYHYGFHILTALWSQMGQLNATDAVLWFGQFLNALLALGIYRVAKAFWKDSRVGSIAALLATFALQMPAYYLSWGRYTLITGLICMLPAMATSLEVLQTKASRESVLRLILLTAGLALVHYMALLFLGLFIGCLLFAGQIQWLRGRQKKGSMWTAPNLGRLAFASLTGIVLALPWLIRMLQAMSFLTDVTVNVPAWLDFKAKFQYIIYVLGPKHNYFLLGGALAGLLVNWFHARIRALALWSTLLIVLSVPWGLQLGPFRPDHMAIMLFLPASWMLAALMVWLMDRLSPSIGAGFSNTLLTLLVIFVLIWGAKNTRAIVNPVTILATQADRQALDWINANTPSDARFFANTTNWQFNVYRGVDGGYWVTPYTRRFSLAMPSLYTSAARDQLTLWKNWLRIANQVTTCDENFWTLVREANLNYIYVHVGRGNLQPAGLESCETISQVYQRDGVQIFQIQSIP